MTTAAATPLGDETFHLVDAIAYAPQDHAGQKIYVRGLLVKLPDEPSPVPAGISAMLVISR